MAEKQLTTASDSCSQEQESIIIHDPLLNACSDEYLHSIRYERQLSIVCTSSTTTISENNRKIDDFNNDNHAKNACSRNLVRFAGILYAFASSLLFTSSNFIIQRLDINLLDVFLVRFFLQGLISIAYFIHKGCHPFSGPHSLLTRLLAVTAAVGNVSFYYGLVILPLPDLTTLRYTQVVWTSILASVLFRQRLNLPIITASILTLMGVVGVAQPSFIFSKSKSFNETLSVVPAQNVSKRLFGLAIALLSAFSISMATVLNKKLFEKKVQQSIILFHIILMTFIFLLINQTYYWTWSTTNRQKFDFKKQYLTKDCLLATILATLQLIPMVLIQKSVKLEHPSIVTVVQASDILIAITLQNIFLATKSNSIALLGSALVLTSIIIVGSHKFWQDRKTNIHCSSSNEDK